MKPALFALVAAASLLSTSGFAAELSCYNIFSKKRSKPLVTATFTGPHKLTGVAIDMPEDQGDIDLKDVDTEAKGEMIAASTSPYQGGQQFILAKGVRLILPWKLTEEGLKDSHFEAGNLSKDDMERQNGVLDIVGGRVSQEQGGDSYFRMHCIAK